MLVQRLSVIAVIGILAMSLCLAACGKKLSDEEFASLGKAVEKKLQTVAQKFESAGLKEAAECCKTSDRVITKAGTFVIDITIAADFYDPKSKTVVKGKEIIFPISMFARVDSADDAEYFLGKGWKFHDLTISAFARDEKDYSSRVITKRKEYK